MAIRFTKRNDALAEPSATIRFSRIRRPIPKQFDFAPFASAGMAFLLLVGAMLLHGAPTGVELATPVSMGAQTLPRSDWRVEIDASKVFYYRGQSMDEEEFLSKLTADAKQNPQSRILTIYADQSLTIGFALPLSIRLMEMGFNAAVQLRRLPPESPFGRAADTKDMSPNADIDLFVP